MCWAGYEYPKSSFRGAVAGSREARTGDASPESITTIGVYGFRACAKKRIPE
jgi:hypothetical protein